jgi:hypothetical protein
MVKIITNLLVLLIITTNLLKVKINFKYHLTSRNERQVIGWPVLLDAGP